MVDGNRMLTDTHNNNEVAFSSSALILRTHSQ